MYRRILVVAAALLSLYCMGSPTLAYSGPAAEHPSVGVGFHDTAAPLGVRWWLASQKVGIDLGLGFHSDDAASSEWNPNPRSMPTFWLASHQRTPRGAAVSWKPTPTLGCSAAGPLYANVGDPMQ